MGGICSMNGANEMCMQNFGRELEDKVNHSEHIGVKGRVLFRKIF